MDSPDPAPATRRFPIRFTGVNKAMVILGITRSGSYVEVAPSDVKVHMTWAFRARIDRSAIRSVEPYHGRVWGWGAHGWGGRWLVNGSSSGIVQISIEPLARARALGIGVKLRTLLVAVDDPLGLVELLRESIVAPGPP